MLPGQMTRVQPGISSSALHTPVTRSLSYFQVSLHLMEGSVPFKINM